MVGDARVRVAEDRQDGAGSSALVTACAVSAPGLVAFGGYFASGLMSKFLMEWFHFPLLHLVVQLSILVAAALSGVTSLFAIPLVGVLGATRRLTGRRLVLAASLACLSIAGSVLMGLWWEKKIPMPGVPRRGATEGVGWRARG